jgi:hypothetical protein
MVPTLEEVNEVAESLFKGGTRYHTEKLAVVVGYVVIVMASLVWAVSGVEIGSGMQGVFETQSIQNIDDQNFVLKNPGSTTWHDVRIVLNDRYLAKVDKVEGEKRRGMKPSDFQYYFQIPRPWGQQEWEKAATQSKPKGTAPGDVEVESLSIRTREGKVDVTVQRDG